MRLLKQLCLFLLAIVATSPAFATTFQVTVTGTVIAGTDTSGFFTGIPGADLTGQSVTIVYYFTPSDISSSDISCGFQCTSAGTSASGYASIQVGSSAPYLDGSTGVGESRFNEGWAPGYEVVIASTYSAAFLFGNAQVSTTATTPDFDWRSPFSYSSSTPALETEAGFDIEDGTNSSTAAFTVASVTQTVSPLACASVTSVTPSIANTNTDSPPNQYPNILGGNVTGNGSTTIKVALAGYDSSDWYPVSFGDLDTAFNTVLTPPVSPNESFASPGIVADNTTGIGTVSYTSLLTTGQFADQVSPLACGTGPTAPLNVYQYYPVINSGAGTQFDMGKSQVGDTAFQNSSDLSQTAIQTFLSDEGSFLATFYVDTTTPSNGGWIDTAGGTTSTYTSSDTPYCMLTTPTDKTSDRTICPRGGESGTLLSSLLSSTASSNTINPKLLLVKMQVEAHLISSPTLPLSSSDDDADIDLLYGLDKALGCNRSLNIGTAAQLSCGASTYSSRFSDAGAFTYPYFFPVDSSEKSALASDSGADITQSIQYAYASPSGNTEGTNGVGCQEANHLNCDLVGFNIYDKSTKVQYNYTPFVQTYTTSGGVRLFEYVWAKYTAASWE